MVAPGGGLVQLRTDAESGDLLIRCSEAEVVRDLFDLTKATGTPRLGVSTLRHLSSPFLQTIVVQVQDKPLLTWRPAKFPRIHSLRLLLKLLG